MNEEPQQQDRSAGLTEPSPGVPGDRHHRSLITPDELQTLSKRNNTDSTIRLGAHLSAIALAVTAAVDTSGTLWSVVPVVALAILLAAIFAPLHESTHGTAFASPQLNRIVALLAGTLFGSSTSGYRPFHFAHHAHTQDPELDPEIALDPQHLDPWPGSLEGWVITLSGVRLFGARLLMMILCWVPGQRTPFAAQGLRPRLETMLASVFWLSVLAGAIGGVPGAREIGIGYLLTAPVHGFWLSAEHSGCANEGSIFARTRSVRSNLVVRYCLWNMNYHGAHHAWPAVPWHALPELQRLIDHRDQNGRTLEDAEQKHPDDRRWMNLSPGYIQLYREQFRRRAPG